MKTVCETNKCNGCECCISICPKKCITINDTIEALNAEINKNLCIDCGLCQRVCPNVMRPNKIKPIDWKQGWASPEIRKESTSGGVATSIAKSFVESGGFVASCLFNNGAFTFELTNDMKIVKRFKGSKYVKSNPKDIYEKISEKLKSNKVLFIGLPCQVAALKNYIKDDNNLYTIDLICHGTPSPKLLEIYLKDKGYSLDDLQEMCFRTKPNMSIQGKAIDDMLYLSNGMDDYLSVFLESVSFTENCYSCQFAAINRISDLTLGDSWGTDFLEQEKKGISLILIQDQKGKDLINMADLNVFNVDIKKAIKNNHQLNSPSLLTDKRAKFFGLINRGYSFSFATFNTLPKFFVRQKLKSLLNILQLTNTRIEATESA